MDCHKLIYKPIRTQGIYQKYVEKLRQKQTTQKKQALYSEILKFKSSRYPREFIEFLQIQINPFEYSLDTLKTIMNNRFPEYSGELVNESVQYIYTKKFRGANMIQQGTTVIEDGEEYIRNGRKLMKEDFTYSNFSKLNMDSSSLIINGKQSSSQLSPGKSPPIKFDENQKGPQSHRNRGLSNHSISSFNPTDREKINSPGKGGQFQIKNEIFNEIISNEIKKQSARHQNISHIFEDDPNDIVKVTDRQSVKKFGITDRSANESFPNFRDRDVEIQQGFETGRSDIEELNHLLSEVSAITNEKEGNTSRSGVNLYSMRINKQNMNDLYDAQGNLKINLVKRAVDRMKREEY